MKMMKMESMQPNLSFKSSGFCGSKFQKGIQ
ncbi:hypothetical protein IHE45_16G068000 [Dioscorea alata]|uniref:Uncharacterized protein n=1 Tax=Dioscorea alata TaxID=55571 RepID=A0ACB7UI82_DIOAL|nr:hypothetical protein IHE45_16G068000 [Dioscorea alata]